MSFGGRCTEPGLVAAFFGAKQGLLPPPGSLPQAGSQPRQRWAAWPFFTLTQSHLGFQTARS